MAERYSSKRLVYRQLHEHIFRGNFGQDVIGWIDLEDAGGLVSPVTDEEVRDGEPNLEKKKLLPAQRRTSGSGKHTL